MVELGAGVALQKLEPDMNPRITPRAERPGS